MSDHEQGSGIETFQAEGLSFAPDPAMAATANATA